MYKLIPALSTVYTIELPSVMEIVEHMMGGPYNWADMICGKQTRMENLQLGPELLLYSVKIIQTGVYLFANITGGHKGLNIS